ncbi:unnamed protein product [Hermetia illucens]|uniref:Uncharacterized protein n=1 Tax=Hermetia illucens TaxID=343691 RepID=A0A7R8V334_HERIL|nr:unnamed protein product [Hermetia illucens]
MFPFIPMIYDTYPGEIAEKVCCELHHHQNKELNILNKPPVLLGAFAASVMLLFLLQAGYISWSKTSNKEPEKKVTKQRKFRSRIPERQVSRERKKKAPTWLEAANSLGSIE